MAGPVTGFHGVTREGPFKGGQGKQHAQQVSSGSCSGCGQVSLLMDLRLAGRGICEPVASREMSLLAVASVQGRRRTSKPGHRPSDPAILGSFRQLSHGAGNRLDVRTLVWWAPETPGC